MLRRTVLGYVWSKREASTTKARRTRDRVVRDRLRELLKGAWSFRAL